MIISNKSPISINNDPWEAYNDILEHNQLTLSNIEFTTTNLCNMRCSHCAVGYTYKLKILILFRWISSIDVWTRYLT